MLSMSSFQVQLLYRNLFLEASKFNKQSYDNKLKFVCEMNIFYLSLSDQTTYKLRAVLVHVGALGQT